MKKRILGLLLALCLVVGLLPAIALAEAKPTLRININYQGWNTTADVAPGATQYYSTWKPEGQSLWYMGMTDASSWNMKVEYPADGSPIVTFKNATFSAETAPQFSTADGSPFNNDITFVIEGENYITRTNIYDNLFRVNASGTTTFTGSGKLKLSHSPALRTGALLNVGGDLVLKGVNLEIEIPAATSRDTNGIIAAGDVTVDGGSLKIIGVNPYPVGQESPYWAAHRPINNALKMDGDLTVKGGANVQIIGSTTNDAGNSLIEIGGGDFFITDSTVELAQVSGTYLTVFNPNNLPRITATYTGSYTVGASAAKGTYDLTAGTFTAPEADNFTKIAEVDLTGLNYFKIAPIVCTHSAAADDGDCTTAIKCALCGTEMTPGAASHTPAADDGDCTTAINCSVCGKEVTPAKASHTAPADRTSCDQAANCTVCNKAIPAGQHTGGTATCKEKATCTVCGAQYGELSTTHTPAADDGDCTTAVKCSVCGSEAVAAKTHAFTNALDTTCDNTGCTHTRVVAPKPDFKLSFATDGTKTANGDGTYAIKTSNMTTASGKATLVMPAGSPTKYYTTGKYSTIPELKDNTYMKETTDTTNWNVKVEYPADGIPTVTLKGAVINNAGGLKFGGWAAPFTGDAKLVIETDSVINADYSYEDGLLFNHVGNAYITGPGKLIVQSNAHENYIGAIGANKANLIFDNANVTVLLSEAWGCSHGISVREADMIVKGGKVKVVGYDDPATTHKGPEGTVDYQLNANAGMAGIFILTTTEGATTGNLIIEGGAEVSVAMSVTAPYDNYKRHNLQAIYTSGKVTVKDSTFEVGMIGKVMEGAKLFAELPTLEFTGNAFTVTATKTKQPTFTPVDYEYDVYTKDGTMAYVADKVVDVFESTTRLNTLTYYKVVPGGSGNSGGTGSGNTGSGNGGGNTPIPDTGDVSLLLIAGIALTSAVGFAGVTILRKKEF